MPRKFRKPVISESPKLRELIGLILPDPERVRGILLELPPETRMVLRTRCRRIYRDFGSPRIQLKELLNMLSAIESQSNSPLRRPTKLERAQAELESRALLKAELKSDLLERIVGGTSITAYKVPGNIKSWGTPRKPHP